MPVRSLQGPRRVHGLQSTDPPGHVHLRWTAPGALDSNQPAGYPQTRHVVVPPSGTWGASGLAGGALTRTDGWASMARYLVGRLVSLTISITAVSVIVFTLMHLVPAAP